MRRILIALTTMVLTAGVAVAQTPFYDDVLITGELMTEDSVKTLTGFYKSDDYGDTWVEIGQVGPTGANGADGDSFFQVSSGVISPISEDTVEAEFLRSLDGAFFHGGNYSFDLSADSSAIRYVNADTTMIFGGKLSRFRAAILTSTDTAEVTVNDDKNIRISADTIKLNASELSINSKSVDSDFYMRQGENNKLHFFRDDPTGHGYFKGEFTDTSFMQLGYLSFSFSAAAGFNVTCFDSDFEASSLFESTKDIAKISYTTGTISYDLFLDENGLTYNDGTIGNSPENILKLKLDGSSEWSHFAPPTMTATEASALTPSNGWMVYVTDTDLTFLTVGFWGYENGSWVKL